MRASLMLLPVLVGKTHADMCTSVHGVLCGAPSTDIDYKKGVLSSGECCKNCENHAGCNSWSWNFKHGSCHLHSSCEKTPNADYVSGTRGGGPAPPAPQPGPPAPQPGPGPSPPSPTGRKGSFLVIGDWGWDHNQHGNVKTDALQRTIAAQMLAKFRELGDVKFIVNLGDSFYPAGITSKTDGKWQSVWRNIYASELRSVPWYTVYGNHDMYDDWGCACGKADGSQCNQINSDINNKNFFYMPGVNWYKEHPELGIEVVALDFNDVSEHPCTYGQASKCESTCMSNLRSRGNAAEALFKSRYSSSSQHNLLVFSHYPTDYFRKQHTGMLGALSSSNTHKISYFGGHRHNTDQSSTASISPNNNWVVGGCGGWSCDGGSQGFVVGEISDSIKTYAVYVDRNVCNRMEDENLNATRVSVIV